LLNVLLEPDVTFIFYLQKHATSVKSTNVWLRASMLSDCCVHLISLTATTKFYFATEYASFAVFGSECTLQCSCISSGLWHGSTYM